MQTCLLPAVQGTRKVSGRYFLSFCALSIPESRKGRSAYAGH